MREYIIYGEGDKSLEQVLEREDIRVRYQATHIPMRTVESDLELEALRELLPDYSVTQPKEIRHDDTYA